jgi:hypothetical protein
LRKISQQFRPPPLCSTLLAFARSNFSKGSARRKSSDGLPVGSAVRPAGNGLEFVACTCSPQRAQ